VIAAAFGFQVVITLYMQRVLGYGAAASGLGLLPTAAVIGTVSLGLSALALRCCPPWPPRKPAACTQLASAAWPRSLTGTASPSPSARDSPWQRSS
jgi:hypothetical protein